MGKLEAMKLKVAEAKEKIENTLVSGDVEGGAVAVTVNGTGKLKEVKISEEFYNESDREDLEELIIVAYNRANEKAEAMSQEEMANATDGMLPPGMGL